MSPPDIAKSRFLARKLSEGPRVIQQCPSVNKSTPPAAGDGASVLLRLFSGTVESQVAGSAALELPGRMNENAQGKIVARSSLLCHPRLATKTSGLGQGSTNSRVMSHWPESPESSAVGALDSVHTTARGQPLVRQSMRDQNSRLLSCCLETYEFRLSSYFIYFHIDLLVCQPPK